MSIDAKGIQLLLWRVIKFSGICFYRFVRKYPVLSGFFIILLFLYMFFYSIFYFLMCFSPILVCTIVSIRFYLKTKYPKFQWNKEKNNDEKSSINGLNGPLLRHQKSVRRNAGKEVEEWNRNHSEERDISSLDKIGNERVHDEDQNFLFDDEASKSYSISSDRVQGQSENGLDNVAVGDDGGKVEAQSLVEWEDEEDKVAPENRNKAPIVIEKINLSCISSNPSVGEIGITGSAPSVSLPTQNPFDLPFAPFEEKPNLLADSFYQEFMAANQKDMPLCRHESFCCRPLLKLEATDGLNDAPINLYHTSDKNHPDKGGHHQHNAFGTWSDTDLVELQDTNLNEKINSIEGKNEMIRESEKARNEVREKMQNIDHLELGSDSRSKIRTDSKSIKNNDSYYSSSSEASESLLDQTSKSLRMHGDQGQKAKNFLIPPKGSSVNRLAFYDFSPSPCERPRTEFNLFYNTNRRHSHTRSCSIASDLYVEASEVGSPPLTNELISSVDGDSVTYDGDIDRDINSDSEEMWGDSFNLSRGEANREKLKELQDITEEECAEVEASGLYRKPEETITSIFPSEQEVMPNLTNTSLLSSTTDIPKNDASHPTITTGNEIIEDVRKIDGVDAFDTFYISDALSPENPRETMHLMEKLVVPSPFKSCSEKAELLMEPQQKPTEEMNIVGDVPITQEDAIILDSISYENGENKAEISNQPAALGEMTKPAEAINLDSSKHMHGDLETSCESKSRMELENKVEERQPLKFVKEDTRYLAEDNTKDAPNVIQCKDETLKHIEEDTQNLTECDIQDAPNAVQSRDELGPVPDRVVDQNVEEDIVSGVNQRFGDPITTNLNRRLAVEQIYAGSYSSHRSVLPENIMENQIPLLNIERRIQTGAPQSFMEGVARDDNMPLIQQQLVDNSVDQSSSNCSFHSLENSAAEVDHICNVNDPLTNDVTNKEVLNNALNAEDGPQVSIKQEDVLKPSKTYRATTAGSVENDEHEPRNQISIQVEANYGPSTSTGESNSLNDIKNGEYNIQNAAQEGILDVPQSGKDNLTRSASIDHEIAIDATKPTESDVKVVSIEESDSNVVAK